MNSNMPVTFVDAQVVAPSVAVAQHATIQQHVGQILQEPGYDRKHVLAAFKTSDLKRLFGEVIPREFYIVNGNTLSYVGMRQHADQDESFGTVIGMNQKVLDAIFADGKFSPANFIGEESDLPRIRITLLVNERDFDASDLTPNVNKISKQEWNTIEPMQRFNADTGKWVRNDDPLPEESKEPPKLHLKDIPLTTRANRRLVRDAIANAREQLEKMHQDSASQLSFDDWMVQAQAVNVHALNDLEKIDNLPDDEYVEAMVAFKKAEVQAYHSQEVKAGRTDLHLFDWTLKNFGEEFNDLGREAALKDIQGIEHDEEADLDIGDEKAIFLVSFDGCVVENQYPSIGPESPFAMGILKALAANGHHVFILSNRANEEYDAMLKFFEAHEFQPVGICPCMWADGRIQREDVKFIAEVNEEDFLDAEIDYLIDFRQFGVPTVQVSGKAEADPTMYWGDMAQSLTDMGYLAPEDMESIMESLHDAAEKA